MGIKYVFLTVGTLKRHFVVFGEEVQTQKYLFNPWVNKQAVLRGKYSPRTLFEAGKVAGSATCKQSETV